MGVVRGFGIEFFALRGFYKSGLIFSMKYFSELANWGRVFCLNPSMNLYLLLLEIELLQRG
jgi:hypothetical protein